MRIAIQGEAGSFHEMAARQWFGEGSILVSKDTFKEVFEALDTHEADAAMTAIENSVYGSISQIYDLIEQHGYPVIGELLLRVEQQLITLPDAGRNSIKNIYSHPVALAQCSDYLDAHFPSAERIEYSDTASAVRHIKELADPTNAAIASQGAADLYDLPVLAASIENDSQNYTRFLAIQPGASAPVGSNASMLSIVTNHKPGALAFVLGLFAEAEINLLKLQSRPIVGSPWQYKFYLDVAASKTHLQQVVEDIRREGNTAIILGEYQQHKAV